jgi:hypothetical protein
MWLSGAPHVNCHIIFGFERGALYRDNVDSLFQRNNFLQRRISGQ